MILVANDNTTFELDRLWIPVNLFNSEKNAGLERNEDKTQTYLIGDQGTKPDWIELRSRRIFKTGSEREVYLANLNDVLNNVNRLEYEEIEIYINFGYYFVAVQSNILDVEITVKLATTISDLKTFTKGIITWGRTDIRFDRTDITFG